jgi:hypothetical protein
MWTYEQTTGNLESAAGTVIATGYSGSPAGKNDPSKQNIPDVGPIPQGEYSIGAPFDADDTGPYSMDLTPAATNVMFGRSGFRMHGDSIAHPGTASEGCIIMPRTAREQVWASGDHTLTVVSGLP